MIDKETEKEIDNFKKDIPYRRRYFNFTKDNMPKEKNWEDL